jgi:uncharacterized protein YoxC
MNGAELAATICAIAFSVLVIAIVAVLVRLARLVDIASATIRETGDSLVPLLDELTEATQSANRQLEKIDVITDSVVETTTSISSLITTLADTIGGPLLRVGEIVRGVTGLLGRKSK